MLTTLDLQDVIEAPRDYVLDSVSADPIARPINPEEFDTNSVDSLPSTSVELAPYSVTTITQSS